MKQHRARFQSLTASLILTFLLIVILAPWANTVLATSLTRYPELSPGHQLLPTGTPQSADSQEVLMTNPALLQVMILFGVIAVLVIFWGVWINRHQVDLR